MELRVERVVRRKQTLKINLFLILIKSKDVHFGSFSLRPWFWHWPEEPLVQMTWSHGEDVDDIIFVLLHFFYLPSTRKSSERQKQTERLFETFVPVIKKGHMYYKRY